MNDTINPISPTDTGGDSLFEVPSMEDESIAGREIERMETMRRFENGMYPYTDKIKRGEYEKEKTKLQVELLKVQK